MRRKKLVGVAVFGAVGPAALGACGGPDLLEPGKHRTAHFVEEVNERYMEHPASPEAIIPVANAVCDMPVKDARKWVSAHLGTDDPAGFVAFTRGYVCGQGVETQ